MVPEYQLLDGKVEIGEIELDEPEYDEVAFLGIGESLAKTLAPRTEAMKDSVKTESKAAPEPTQQDDDPEGWTDELEAEFQDSIYTDREMFMLSKTI